jgi:hypothetical protein
VPFDWQQTGDGGRTFDHQRRGRQLPAAAGRGVRLTSNLKLGFSMQDVYATVDSRTYLFELQVKTP